MSVKGLIIVALFALQVSAHLNRESRARKSTVLQVSAHLKQQVTCTEIKRPTGVCTFKTASLDFRARDLLF